MKIVVIGGQARKVGKTSVMTGLIRRMRDLDWVAVKISRHEGQVCTRIESEPSSATDTGRYLLAGAKRALWMQVESGQLPSTIPSLITALKGEPYVMIESTAALSILSPDAGIIVLDRSRRDVKPSLSRAIKRADAIVEIASEDAPSGSVVTRMSRARRFAVSRNRYISLELCRFVRWKLRDDNPQ